MTCTIAIKKCDEIHKHLINTQLKAPQLNAHLKTHKEDMPISPVINNTQAPSHKIAKFLNNKLQNIKIIPNTYNIKNSIEIAEEITQLNINQNNKLITLDINDLYTNLPKQGLTMAARQWLQQSAVNHEESKQIILLINTIMEQNYIQYKIYTSNHKKESSWDPPFLEH